MSPTVDPIAKLREFWNGRYEAEGYAYGTAPNAFLVESSHLLPAHGRVLCLADGEGRNGAWLAAQGFDVTSVDIAEAGLVKARALAAARGVAIATEAVDVTTFELGRERWDAIVSIFLHLPARPRAALHARCVQALRPGGVFVFTAYTPEQLACGTGGPKEAELLPALADVEADFAPAAGCAIEHRFSGLKHVVEGRLHSGDAQVAELVVRKLA